MVANSCNSEGVVGVRLHHAVECYHVAYSWVKPSRLIFLVQDVALVRAHSRERESLVVYSIVYPLEVIPIGHHILSNLVQTRARNFIAACHVSGSL